MSGLANRKWAFRRFTTSPNMEVFWIVGPWGGSERGKALRTGEIDAAGLPPFFLAFIRLTRADDQIETSQPPVQATVSSEAIRMQANAPPEGLIHLDVAAIDREGKPFSGLGAKDFTLIDNGLPQKIVSFEAANQATDEDERLTEVVLVLDEVDLSPVQLELVKGESIKFLRQNGGHLTEPTSVYWFTTAGLYATENPQPKTSPG